MGSADISLYLQPRSDSVAERTYAGTLAGCTFITRLVLVVSSEAAGRKVSLVSEPLLAV
jgi:hypothetical protein